MMTSVQGSRGGTPLWKAYSKELTQTFTAGPAVILGGIILSALAIGCLSFGQPADNILGGIGLSTGAILTIVGGVLTYYVIKGAKDDKLEERAKNNRGGADVRDGDL